MKPTGDLVSAAAELAPSMERGHDQLKRRFSGFFVGVDGYSATVVGERDDIIFSDGAGNRVAIAAKRFINRVVKELPDELMEAALTGISDVHARAPSHAFKTLEVLNLVGVVSWLSHCVFQFGCHVSYSF